MDRVPADDGPVARSRGRVQHLIALLQIVVGVPYVVLFLALGQTWSVALLLAPVVAPVALFGLTRRGLPAQGGRVLSVAAMLFIAGCLYARGGMHSNSAAWLLVTPILATFMVGPRHGISISAAVACAFVGLFGLEQLGVPMPAPLPDPVLTIMPVVDYPVLVLVVGSIVWAQAGVWERAELEARDAAKARYTFLATMSHEIRTPLNGVLGLAEILLDTPLGEDQQKLVGTIRDSGKLLRTLLDDVLDYAKTDSGHVEVEHLPVRLRELANEVIELWRLPAGEAGIQLRARVDEDVADLVRTDPTKLRQILGNLTSNALKFTEQGEVRLHVSVEEDSLRFDVIDTGVGMPETVLEHIFEAFQQADGTTTRKFGGTGLGLAISRDLARHMGGSLEVRSTLGEGSTFSLCLPLDVVEEAAEDALVEGKVAAPLQGLTVLVAEDNAVNRMVIRRLLEREGVTVRIANDGAACVAEWQADSPDLILMDCQMPVCDGYEASRQIRASGGTMPIIALTANSMPGDRARCIEAGMDGHLGKPIDVVALRAALDSAARGRATRVA